jgi:hypothetical protein
VLQRGISVAARKANLHECEIFAVHRFIRPNQ